MDAGSELGAERRKRASLQREKGNQGPAPARRVAQRSSWCHSSRYLAIKHSWCLQNTATAFHLLLQHLLSAAGTPRKRPCKVLPKRLQCELEKSQLGESKTEQREPTGTHLAETSFNVLFLFPSGMSICLHHRSTLKGELPWPRSSKKR